ncbi:hypothetical protein Syun_012936 [Stephania yunnanensis]|uniref:RING-type domain-containing protein n=1 Tax=Stephania yunnanensis TaxID=152371 RepID=A0AAP0K0H2_9MAGN
MAASQITSSLILGLPSSDSGVNSDLGMNLITTVIGFGMSATFIVFVCTRLICGRVRANSSRPIYELDSVTDIEQPDHRSNGLEPVVISAIPTMKFSRETFQSADTQCTICLGEYQEKETLRIMPICGHNFHLTCIDVWLHKHSTCPVCRLPLEDSFETKPIRAPVFGMLFQSIDSPRTPFDHSQQWLLPVRERSEINRSNQIPQSQESTSGNTDATTRTIATESRR